MINKEEIEQKVLEYKLRLESDFKNQSFDSDGWGFESYDQERLVNELIETEETISLYVIHTLPWLKAKSEALRIKLGIV